VRASANLPVFHSMLPGSAMASLSPAMRRRVSGISGTRDRLPEMGDACFGSKSAVVGEAGVVGIGPLTWPRSPESNFRFRRYRTSKCCAGR
jgi:hypothetical protein